MKTLVLWDIDGTLVLTGRAGVRALDRALAEVCGRAGLLEHGPHGQVVRASTGFGAIAVDEQELVNAVSGGGQQISPEPQHVAVPGVEARHRAATHQRHLVSDGDARDCCSTDVVVRDQEPRRDRAQHADLMTHPHQVGPRRWLDLADHLELARHGYTA